jgi:hypothetical protein
MCRRYPLNRYRHLQGHNPLILNGRKFSRDPTRKSAQIYRASVDIAPYAPLACRRRAG